MLNVTDSLPMPYTSLIRNQGAGKESESSSFPQPPHPPPASPYTLSFACHSKLLPVIITLITFLGSCARSLFGEPVYIRSSDEKFELFTY